MLQLAPTSPYSSAHLTKEGIRKEKKEKNLDSCQQTSGETQEYNLFPGDTLQSRGTCGGGVVILVCVCVCVVFSMKKGKCPERKKRKMKKKKEERTDTKLNNLP